MGNQAMPNRFGKTAAAIGVALLILGALLLCIKAVSSEYVDADGLLHEWFFLLPSGFGCLLGGCLSLLSAGAAFVMRKTKGR